MGGLIGKRGSERRGCERGGVVEGGLMRGGNEREEVNLKGLKREEEGVLFTSLASRYTLLSI